MTMYELMPVYEQNQSSFYGKAKVIIEEKGARTLYSYDTKIMTIRADGSAVRYWDDWTNTTGKHIYAFCGMHKKEYMQLKLVK